MEESYKRMLSFLEWIADTSYNNYINTENHEVTLYKGNIDSINYIINEAKLILKESEK